MQITRQQSFLIAGLILFVFILGGALIMRKQASPTIKTENTNTATVEQENKTQVEPPKKNVVVLKKFQRSEVKDGKRIWDVQAVKGKHIPEDKKSFLEQPVLTLYHDDGNQTTVTSKKATLFHSETGLEKAELFESVKVNAEGKMLLNTEQATFFTETQQVYAPGLVKINTDGIQVTGEELQGNLEENTFSLTKNVDTIIKPRKKNAS